MELSLKPVRASRAEEFQGPYGGSQLVLTLHRIYIFCFQMCNYLLGNMKNGDAGIFPVYYSLNTGAGVMYGWCLAYYTGVVLNTVRESATPVSKVNKQADAGSRRFRRHFLCGALLCKFSSTEHEGLSTHVQRECSAKPFMRSVLSLRIFTSRPGSGLRFIYQDANSVLLLAHFCTAVLLGSIRKTLCLKLFMMRA